LTLQCDPLRHFSQSHWQEQQMELLGFSFTDLQGIFICIKILNHFSLLQLKRFFKQEHSLETGLKLSLLRFFFTIFFKVYIKARNFRTFCFREFRKCSVFEVRNFFRKNPNFLNLQKFRENSLEISSEIISCFWVKKPCFGVKKFGKVWKQGFLNIRNLSKIQNLFYSELSKITKNDVKIKFRKSRKTRSDSKTNLNVRFKVWNAVP